MRKITDGYELELRYGETRIVEKFLYFPKTLDHELRWWESAKIVQNRYGWKWRMGEMQVCLG